MCAAVADAVAGDRLGSDSDRRAWLLTLCQVSGEGLRGDDYLERRAKAAAARVVRGYADRAQHDVSSAQAHIERLIRAYALNIGGRGKRPIESVRDATEALCKSLGWRASAETIKRTTRRRRNPQGNT
jgi:hypothetical protein